MKLPPNLILAKSVLISFWRRKMNLGFLYLINFYENEKLFFLIISMERKNNVLFGIEIYNMRQV